MTSPLQPTTAISSSTNSSLWSTLEGRLVDGKYHLGRLISSGSYGGVFEADEVVADQLIRRVAIKLITPDAELPERQLQELILATRLDHANILRCFSPGACDLGGVRLLYIVMELASQSLATRFTDGLLDENQARILADNLLCALIYLGSGEQPMVHRDLKPANILLVNGVWKLADFGLLRGIGPERVAQTRTLLGTAEYAPPEAYEGIVSTAWDVWSAGVILVEAMTGHLPFDEPSPQELQRAIMQRPAAKIDQLPGALAEIVRGCLTKERMKRWTAEEALGVLRGTAPAPTISTVDAGPSKHQQSVAGRRAKYPFRFKFGSADTIPEFIALCEEYPFEAQDYLMNKFVGKWMGEALDDPSLAREAFGYGQLHWHEPERAVELFVRELRRLAGLPFDPEMTVTPERLDFSLRPVGDQTHLMLHYRCKARGHVWGVVEMEGNLPGVVPDKSFGVADAPVAVRLDTIDVAPGYYEGTLVLRPAGLTTAIRVPITYTIVPLKAKVTPMEVHFGAIERGQTAVRQIEITTTSARARVRGTATVVPPTPGLTIDPNFVGEKVQLKITADAAILEAGREYVRRVRLSTNAGSFEIPVRLRTAIRVQIVWIYAGYMATAGAGIGAAIRFAIQTGAGTGRWFLVYPAGVANDTLFRIIGSSLVAFIVGGLFRCFAQGRWPLLFERQRRSEAERQANGDTPASAIAELFRMNRRDE